MPQHPRHSPLALVRYLAPAMFVALAIAQGCSRAGGDPQDRPAVASQSVSPRLVATPAATDRSVETAALVETPDVDPQPEPTTTSRLDASRAQGRFEEFIDAALNAAHEHPDDVAARLHQSEALLAAGRNAEAEAAAQQAAELAVEHDVEAAAHAARLWTTARLRQGQPLDDEGFQAIVSRLPAAEPHVHALVFWRGALAGRAPYRLEAPDGPAELLLSTTEANTVPRRLNAVQARANGVTLPLVFVDTGATHTLMTVQAAQSAGVSFGDNVTQLMGFRGLSARPGLIERLELGDLVLEGVPVLVGDSIPLVALGGQMAIGTDLMHHVRFRLDYPARRVIAEPAATPPNRQAAPLWEIPIWPFSQICLARGESAGGVAARVLVDTGDSAGTFVSHRWARRHLEQFRGPTSSLVFRFKKRNWALERLDLGSLALDNWPVTDTIPKELDRLNQVDIILGRDLLWPYQLTIDLPRRVLQFHSGTSPQGQN